MRMRFSVLGFALTRKINNIMKTYYDERPTVIEAVGDGGWYYRWNINEVQFESEDAPRTQWECEQVIVYAPLTSNKIVQAVIGEVWGLDIENKMLNEFNGAQLGIYDEATTADKIAKYKAFLTERHALKAQVDSDCKEAGIK